MFDFRFRPDLDRSWMVAAACRDLDPDLFFPDRGHSTSEARAVCADCPVRSDCLEYALESVEQQGIWGGTSETERRTIRGARFRARQRELRNAPS
jgi:WhiB family redox-sensing transcriptional regulator